MVDDSETKPIIDCCNFCHKHASTMSSKSTAGASGDVENKFMDITHMVDECASSLSFTHPMLCIETFSLQDSMAAMELLDPKMDSCEVPADHMVPQTEESQDDNKNSKKILYPRPPPTQLDDEFLPLPWNDLTVRDSIFVSVEALVRLESMLGGASVVESTYTCLYAHSAVIEDMKDRLNPPNETLTEKFEKLLSSTAKARGTLAQHVVFTTSLALVEITEIMRSIVLHGDIYEEEDFCANTYNVPIYSNREKDSTMGELTYTLQLAEGQKTLKDSDEGKALLGILGFLIDLLKVASSVARVAGSKVVEVMKETKESIRSAVKHLTELRTVFARLKQQETTAEKHLLQRTFDPFVNRPLFGNSPVRKVIFLEPDKSLEQLSKIVAEVDWTLCDLILKGTSLKRIRRILDRLSGSLINILSRSLMVLNLYFDEKLLGQFSLLDLIVQHMQDLAGVPSDVFESKHGQIFLNRLAKPVYDTLKLRLLNRNRQRAYMEAVIIQDWAQLQQEAHIVDVHYRKDKGLDSKSPPYISHYVLANLVDLMDLHVTIGVELSLFQSQEDLAIVYWYRDFLLSTLLNNMSAMQRTKEAAAKAADQSSESGGGKSGKGKKKHQNKKNGSSQQKGAQNVESDFDYMVIECKRGLCRGLVRFISALHQAKALDKQKYQFTTSEKVFKKRFEVFANIQQPPPLSYDDFVQGSDFSRVSQGDLLFSTAECFKSSKATVGKLLAMLPSLDSSYLCITKEELNQIAKVCVGNSVYVQKMKQTVSTSGGKVEGVSFDFDTNKAFCTVKLS